MLGTRARNLDVHAHWIVLRAVFIAGRVESDDLMTKNEVTGEAAGDRRGPGDVVRCKNALSSFYLTAIGKLTKQIIRRPCARIRAGY